MNIAKKDYPFWILIGVAIIVVIFLVKNKGDQSSNVSESVSPTPHIKVTVPSPELMSSEVSNYQAAVAEFEGRRILLDAECSSANPSNITFPNLTQIMIDNRLSNEPRIVRIGDRVYNLVAHGWYITTLYSAELPANIPFYCGDIELGQLGLE